MEKGPLIQSLLERAFGMLQAGRSPAKVEGALIASWISEDAAKIVVSQLATNLSNYRAYKRAALSDGTNSEILWGVAIIVLAFVLSDFTPEAAGRFRNLHIVAYLVGAGFIGHALYWKMKAR